MYSVWNNNLSCKKEIPCIIKMLKSLICAHKHAVMTSKMTKAPSPKKKNKTPLLFQSHEQNCNTIFKKNYNSDFFTIFFSSRFRFSIFQKNVGV